MDSHASRLFDQGNLHLASGDRDGAEACFRHAVSIAPEMAEAHANLGWVMAEKGMTAQAQEFYRQALVRSASHVGIRLNYGAFLARLKRFDAAERVYLGAIDRGFDNARVWSNLGALYAQMERFAEAEACCGIALALDENYPNAHVNLAYLCLRRGEFEEGWQHYEWRGWQTTLYAAEAHCRRWRGEALAGRSIVIGHEAGFGDAIQFCRHAAELKARGARHVTLVCPAPLQALFATLRGVDEVLDRAALPEAPRWDFWVSLMSLPQLLETRVDSIPASLPYLFPAPADAARWRSLMPPDSGRLRVGVCWRGNPDFENDADRSLHALEPLAELLSAPGIDFVVLQKELTAEEAELIRPLRRVCRVTDRVESFADTAAIVAGLDLVVCVDTAIAHLAGALGKECWLLLPRHMTDWRWLSDREDSPWYPGTMRLFKQPRIGDWASVVAAVRAELALAAARLVGSRA